MILVIPYYEVVRLVDGKLKFDWKTWDSSLSQQLVIRINASKFTRTIATR